MADAAADTADTNERSTKLTAWIVTARENRLRTYGFLPHPGLIAPRAKQAGIQGQSDSKCKPDLALCWPAKQLHGDTPRTQIGSGGEIG